MTVESPNAAKFRLRWKDVYNEAELYKAAIRVYTKPVFQWRKALATSTDGKTLYDFAAHGLERLGAMHRSLERREFEFRPSVALHYNFNGRHRTLYIPPWQERIVDLLLYRVVNRRLSSWFSPNSYAYRDRGRGLDACQRRIARTIASAEGPLYVVRRDVQDFFVSIDHELMLGKLAALTDTADYLYRLLAQRVRFVYEERGSRETARVGVPFGTSIACLLANIYLTDLDRAIEREAALLYFRYADDLLLISPSRGTALRAANRLGDLLSSLKLRTKASHQADLLLAEEPAWDSAFAPVTEFRHLGLLFRAGGAFRSPVTKCEKSRTSFASPSGAGAGAGRRRKTPDGALGRSSTLPLRQSRRACAMWPFSITT
jgi:Reverse transcriptase (RNA-dependent DNA polymerase)